MQEIKKNENFKNVEFRCFEKDLELIISENESLSNKKENRALNLDPQELYESSRRKPG